MKRLLLSFLVFPLLAHANLEFEATTLKSDAELGADEAPFVFKFKSTGEKRVRITDIEVSCGCLEATASKAEFASGDTGEIKVVMKVGSLEGELTKFVTVMTNDPKQPTIQLDCSINVPKLYEFTPMTTTWDMGSAAVTKEVKITVLGPDPINILKFASTRPNMEAELAVTKPGREYLLKLTPKSTEAPELGLVTFETDSKIPKYTKRQIFFTIVRPRPAAPAGLATPAPATPTSVPAAKPATPKLAPAPASK